MEVEEAQGEGRKEGEVVKNPAWYMTSDEYFALVKECLEYYGDQPEQRWHPEDLEAQLEAIQTVMSKVLRHVCEKDRVRV